MTAPESPGTVAEWPRPGRCSACLQPAESYPSGRWRHIDGPCPWRSSTVFRPGDMPEPPVGFVADGEPLPRPDWHREVVYEGDVPVRINMWSPSAVSDYWDRARDAHTDTEEAR